MRDINRVYLALLATAVWAACDSSEPAASEPDAATDGPDTSEPDADADGGAPPGDASAPDSDGDVRVPQPEGTVLYDPCAQENRLGGFEAVVLSDYSSVQGAVANGVVPGSVRAVELEEGGCTLSTTQNPFCDPACGAGETCDFDGDCIAVPVQQDLGTVAIDGLNVAISMEPRTPGNNYFETNVPHPLFDLDNDEVRLTTTGGYLSALTLFGAGSDAIEAQPEQWIITPGQDLTVSWAPPSSEPRTAVVLTLAVDQHGTTPSTLECEFEDIGQGVVPAAVIDALIAAGVSGFPSGRLTRGTVDSVQVDQGCVEFSVASSANIDVSVVGYTPCTGPGTCPDNMTCNLETFLCE